MEAVQRLRQRAEAAGSLGSTPQQTVSLQDQEITIEPANPAVIYLPAYNPWCAYGAWPYRGYPPYYLSGTWTGYCAPADAFLIFGVGIYPRIGYWAWGHCDWRRHRIRIDHDRYQRFHARDEPPQGTWQHNPAHRRGVPYRDPATAVRFLGSGATAQRNFRGYPQAAPPQVTRGAAGWVGQPAPAGIPAYAQHFMSSPGRENGLYWPAKPGEEESPLGPLIAQARAAGYTPGMPHPKPRPYYGYYFRILTEQGADAPGGAKPYVANDHMTGGFALLAYPAAYGNSGVMTFIVNQDGIVYQRNLGSGTARLARRIEAYDPDASWQPSPP